MAISGKITFRCNLRYTSTSADVDAVFAPNYVHRLSFSDGTGANQADILYMRNAELASGADLDLDLAGVLSDALGNTVACAEVCGMLVVNQSADGTAGDTILTIGNAASNPWTGWCGGADTAVTIGRGGFLLFCNPDASGIGAVTGGSADTLRITAGDQIATASDPGYAQIMILGRTA